MSFKLKKNEAAGNGIKRILIEQSSKAISDLMYLGDDRDERIHDARKSFKKIRALLRLIRNEISEEQYRRENECIRDAGRKLAVARNSLILINSLDSLSNDFNSLINVDLYNELKKMLRENYEIEYRNNYSNENLAAEIVQIIHSARARFQNMNLNSCDFDSIKKGLRIIYKQGYKQTFEVNENSSDENLHELRKRVKYLWYVLRLFKAADSKSIKKLIEDAHQLSDFLGEDHDLAELKNIILIMSKNEKNRQDINNLLLIIEKRREQLQSFAMQLSGKVYKYKPGKFVNKIESDWNEWKNN